MASIGTLSATITANGESFVREMDRASNRARRAAGEIKSSLDGMSRGVTRNFAQAGFGVLGAGSAVALVAREIRDVIQNTSEIKGISPETLASVEALKSAFENAHGAAQTFIADAIAGISNLGRNLGIVAGSFVFGIDSAAETLNQIEAADRARIESLRAEKLAPLNAKLEEARAAYLGLELSAGAAADRVFESAEALEAAAQTQTDEKRRIELLTQAYQKYADATRTFFGIRKELAGLEEQFAAAQDRQTATVAGARGRIAALLGEKARLEGDPSVGTAQNLEARVDVARKLVEQQRTLNELLDRQATLAANVGATLAASFESAAFEGGKLRDVVNGIISDLSRLVFQNLVTTPLAGAITDGIKGIFGGGKASGGPVSAGKAYLVGERGPELFAPRVSGAIVPNHRLATASTAESITINNYVQAGVSRAELIPALNATSEATIARIVDLQRRRKA